MNFRNIKRYAGICVYVMSGASMIWLLLFNMLKPLRWLSGKESACQSRKQKSHGFNSWVRKIPWRRKWQPTPVFFPGKSHGQRSLESYCLWGCKKLDMTEHHHQLQIPNWKKYHTLNSNMIQTHTNMENQKIISLFLNSTVSWKIKLIDKCQEEILH